MLAESFRKEACSIETRGIGSFSDATSDHRITGSSDHRIVNAAKEPDTGQRLA
jgi:hypothetical protein